MSNTDTERSMIGGGMETEIHSTIRRLRSSAYANGDREDLVQETLARATAHGVPYSALPWMRTVLKRLAIDLHRRRREHAVGGPVELDRLCPDTHLGPEERVLSAERMSALREALGALPERQRDALMALAEEGKPSAVADRLGMDPGATWTLLSRARKRFREELDRIGYLPAVIVGRLNRRWTTLAEAGFVVGLAVTVSLSPTASPAPVAAAARPTVAIVDRPAAAPVPDRPEATAVQPSKGHHPAALAPAVPKVEERVRVEADTCQQITDEGEPLSVAVTFEDDESHGSLSEVVVDSVPRPARELDAGGCET